jgi:serine phosphatase RsbU (regulator of sigma subunit)
MTDLGDPGAAASAVGVAPRARDESAELVCNEVWGGNRNFYGPVELPGMRGVLLSQPCVGARGGDVHYLSVCGSGLVSRACLADVTGHGERVAAVGESMHDLLRRSVNRMDQRKVLRRLNLRLLGLAGDSFTTASVLTYFPPTRRLSISYAGHEPAWYYSVSDHRWSRLETPSRRGLFDVALGVEPRTRYTHCVRRVTVGDRLLMVTDGVLETPNDRDELFGRERLDDFLNGSRDHEPQSLVQGIMTELRKHARGALLEHDDVSLLLIEFVDNMKSSALWTVLQNRLFRGRRARKTLTG